MTVGIIAVICFVAVIGLAVSFLLFAAGKDFDSVVPKAFGVFLYRVDCADMHNYRMVAVE